jgi:hypothetical protein
VPILRLDKMKMVQACISVREDHWKRFAGVAAAEGLSTSACLRLLVASFLWDKAGVVAGPRGLNKGAFLIDAIQASKRKRKA